MRAKAWLLLRVASFILGIYAYGFVWVIWGAGGLQLLGILDIPLYPLLVAMFIVASVVVMLVGLIGFWRDMLGFLGLASSKQQDG